MPWTWIAPEPVLDYHGVRVYHLYRDDIDEVPYTYWYEVGEDDFDIRDLPVGSAQEQLDPVQHPALLRTAVDSDLISDDGVNWDLCADSESST